jgi:hypothetical protein
MASASVASAASAGVAGAVTTTVGAATDVPGSAVVAAQKYVLKASIFFICHTYRTSLNKDETPFNLTDSK